jgi:peptidoglycan/xylan/chitin deacetylase (PgdA/CDA1 family)
MHGVHTPAMADQTRPPRGSIPVGDFERNIRLLLRRYLIISLDDAITMLKGHSAWQEDCFVLTFDDSLKCLVEVAAPIVRSLGIVATFFVSTEVIANSRPYWWRRLEHAFFAKVPLRIERRLSTGCELSVSLEQAPDLDTLKRELRKLPSVEREDIVNEIEQQVGGTLVDNDPHAAVMNWDDVNRLRTLGMEIGSHTVTHANVERLHGAELITELADSRAEIESRVKVPCRHFCYPYGMHSPLTARVVRDVGYVSAVTTVRPGWNYCGNDLFTLRRSHMPKAAYRLARMMMTSYSESSA